MPILCRLAVNRLDQIQLFHNDPRPQIEIRLHDLHQLLAALLARTIRLDEHGQRLRDADGVRELHERASGELGVHERFRDPARQVGGRAVDLAVVLAGEGAAAVRAPAAVGVDDDFAARQAGVALGAADDEEA